MITQKPNGRWLADIEPIKGKRFRKTFKTKAEALRFESLCRTRLITDSDWNPRPKDRQTFTDLIQLWFDVHGHTLRDAAARLRKLNYLAAALSDPVASTFDPTDFNRYRKQRLESGISPKTLNNELGYINSVFNELHALGKIKFQTPLSSVKPLRLQQQELSYLTLDQITELLDAIRNRHYSSNSHMLMIVFICLATGARWSEAVNLRPTALRNASITYSQTKSGKLRTVPIDKSLFLQIHEHWKRFGFFSCSITSFRRAMAATNIQLPKGQASHVLRHTFASHFMMNGGNILTLQKILGHSSVNMTMRYAHLSPDHLQDAIKYGPLSRVVDSSTRLDKPDFQA
ncbi:tyrosine-type recombinase/integrase [Nitrincola sp.]|uniref:phage integrase n=1 Tax=Nitrincola sp. TaxID=1926584 RepID=UPI003A91BA92